MRVLKKVGIGLAGLIALLVVVGFFLPAGYSAQRTIVVDAPIETVFEQVNDLEKANVWSPWKEADPTLKVTYGATTVGQGASYDWTGESSGDGTLTIASSTPHSSITTDLDFKAQGKGTGHWTFEDTGSGVKVTWGMSGDAGMNLINRYFGLFIDSMAGPMFEKGLANLKGVCESAA